MTDLNMQIVHLQHPPLRGYVTPVQAEQLKHRFCYLTPMLEYARITAELANSAVDVIQLPFTPISVPSHAELMQKASARREQGLRLQELTKKRREEKLAADQLRLQTLVTLQRKETHASAPERKSAILEEGFKNEGHLQKAIDELADRVSAAHHKNLAGNPELLTEERMYPLIKSDDKSLDNAQKVQKGIQLALKTSVERRQKILAAKEAARAKHVVEQEKLAQLRKDDPDKWTGIVKEELANIRTRMERRKKLRADLNDRSSVAYRRRQKMINDAANEGAGDEDFGANDDDWLVYQQMSAGRGDAVDEEDEDDEARLAELEAMLAEHDPTSLYLSYEEQARLYQIQMGIVRVRVPECLFQPSIIGVDQAGVVEIMHNTLQNYSTDIQQKMTENLFLTGGLLHIKGLEERFRQEITALRPAGSGFTLRTAGDPSLDGWSGARQWALGDEFKQACVTRQEYEECGGDYLKEHSASNLFHHRHKKARK